MKTTFPHLEMPETDDVPSEAIFSDVKYARWRRRRIARLMTVGAAVTFLACAFWSFFAVLNSSRTLLATALLGIGYSILILRMIQLEKIDAARLLSMIGAIALVSAVTLMSGIESGATEVTHLYFLPIAVGSYVLYSDRKTAISHIFAGISLLLFAIVEFDLVVFERVYAYPLTDDFQILRHRIAFIFAFLATVFLTLYFVRDISEAELQLKGTNERMETLIANMLPKKIAARLHSDRNSFAESFQDCSILFADIVGFTRLCNTRSAKDVVDLLNQLFSDFDDLVEQYGLEKIKTIGDAYHVAAGIPEPLSNHAEATARLAISMREAARRFGLELRIGINSGTVVAGVIGKKRYSYDLWGDTVNLASRMESHGVPGAIQVTESTYKLLKDGFRFEDRGFVDVKGKGALRAYLLNEA
jgi:class 3 adenylate cyclase